VASDPESQGHGSCKQAMTVLTEATDKCGCRAIVLCFGFQATKPNNMCIGEGRELLEFPGCSMTRPAKLNILRLLVKVETYYFPHIKIVVGVPTTTVDSLPLSLLKVAHKLLGPLNLTSVI
jgi:hypothetical protein